MKKCTCLAAVVLFATIFVIPKLAGEEAQTGTFTVRSTEVVTGVVIISGQMATAAGKRSSAELQCNKGQSQCAAPPAGTYVMVQLPKNRGTYDCANVELYPKDADPATSEKIGAYCLTK